LASGQPAALFKKEQIFGTACENVGGIDMMLMIILPVFVLIALVACLPIWPHSKKWSFYNISGVSLVILIILYLFWTHRS
jgi:hypothetical protein